jgi:hypothetical protein
MGGGLALLVLQAYKMPTEYRRTFVWCVLLLLAGVKAQRARLTGLAALALRSGLSGLTKAR